MVTGHDVLSMPQPTFRRSYTRRMTSISTTEWEVKYLVQYIIQCAQLFTYDLSLDDFYYFYQNGITSIDLEENNE